MYSTIKLCFLASLKAVYGNMSNCWNKVKIMKEFWKFSLREELAARESPLCLPSFSFPAAWNVDVVAGALGAILDHESLWRAERESSPVFSKVPQMILWSQFTSVGPLTFGLLPKETKLLVLTHFILGFLLGAATSNSIWQRGSLELMRRTGNMCQPQRLGHGTYVSSGWETGVEAAASWQPPAWLTSQVQCWSWGQ